MYVWLEDFSVIRIPLKFYVKSTKVRKVHKWYITLYQIYHGKFHSYNIENFFPAFKYNAEKEQKNDWEAKQKELARIEEAKKAEEEKGTSFVNYICFVRIPCRNLSSHNWHNENKWFDCRF